MSETTDNQIVAMQKDIQQTKETNERIESKLDGFINEVKNNYARKDEVDRNKLEQDRRMAKIEMLTIRLLWAIGGVLVTVVGIFIDNLL